MIGAWDGAPAGERVGHESTGKGGLFRDERGITTLSMSVSIFLCMALIFTSAQLYRVSSASAEVQEVADAAALAASNEVAEYVAAVNVCDASILSLTLLSGTLFGLGVVAACIPPTAALSEKLIEAAKQILDKRDRFHDGAVKGLNALQKLLPFLAAANAMGVAAANNSGAMDASYFGIAALVPFEGVPLGSTTDDKLVDLRDSIDGSIDDIREGSKEAEEAAKKANDAKERAFRYDCGSAPGACMYERAGKLSEIGNDDNVLYTNVDAWSFQVPLKRIRAYYASRKSDPIATSGSIESRADSALRKRFYEYASKEFATAYIEDAEGAFSYNLPRLFKNTAEMKATELYTEVRYPVTQSGATLTMHAWSGCPKAAGYVRLGSISEMDAGSFTLCPSCEFRVSSMGSVASASTNVSNGFEHHYAGFRQAVEDYADARSELDPLANAVKEKVQPLFDMLKDALKDAIAKRLKADPPGKYGAIAMVVNTAKPPADTGFQSLFVASGSTLGATAAVSGSTLLKDASSDGSSVITRIAGNLVEDVPVLGNFTDIVTSCWTAMLRAYSNGQATLNRAIEDGLNSFSTTTASGLGTWVSASLADLISTLGLEPADIDPRMPVLVNTGNVACDDGAFSTNFMKVKQGAMSASTSSTGSFSSLATLASASIKEKVESSWANVTTFTDPTTGEAYTIEWALPDIGGSAGTLLDQSLARMQQDAAQLDPVRSWQ